jgi:glycosyltransferase involved in cell wall biosynthesis
MRITVVTSYFPTSARPYGGNSAFQTLRLLKPHASISVVCPLERYPNIRGLKPARYERADLNWQPPEFQTTYVEYPAIPIVTRPFNGRICASILLPHVRLTRPDLILNYWLYPDGYAAVRIGRELGVPVIVGAIGSDIRRRNDPITIRLVRQTMLQADAVITVSEELRQRTIAQGIPAGKVTAILNGCDTAVFHPGDRAAARQQVGCDAETELIVYAGNLLATKGLGELMEAFIELAKSRPRLRLAMIGQGPFGEGLARRAAAAGIEGRVIHARPPRRRGHRAVDARGGCVLPAELLGRMPQRGGGSAGLRAAAGGHQCRRDSGVGQRKLRNVDTPARCRRASRSAGCGALQAVGQRRNRAHLHAQLGRRGGRDAGVCRRVCRRGVAIRGHPAQSTMPRKSGSAASGDGPSGSNQSFGAAES